MTSLVKKKGAAGALITHWGPAPVDDEDSAHVDDKRYVIQSRLWVGEFSQSQQKELLDNDSFQVAAQRLLTDLFTDLGTKFDAEPATPAESGDDEILVELSGIRDFSEYNRLKTIISSQFKDPSTVIEDREFSKGQVVFAVYSKIKTEDLRKQIAQITLKGNGDSPVKMVIR